ncbi:hypothetical protein KUL156_12640 [Alteromonas sp. KUL156]|nr:hypothetical protein KUL154_41750 [Alteromonas sp. KUL154]GFD98671.1 hypothetical protein KUL156_12640 [Alteromonas sp. KUL156]
MVVNQSTGWGNKDKGTSGALFFFYNLYLIDFFFHLTSRIPILGKIRLTALLFLITWILALVDKQKIACKPTNQITSAMNALLVYLAATLLLTEYAGSVIRGNLLPFMKAISFFYFTVFCVDTLPRFKKVLALFIGLQLFRVLEPLYLNITQGYWGSMTYLGGEYANRLSGAPHDIINSNELGFVIATIFPFLYFMHFMGKTFIKKCIVLVLLSLLGYAMILTMSRGAFLALCVGLLFLFKNAKNKTLLIVLGIVGVFAALSVMTDIQRERYLSIFGASKSEGSNRSADGRIKGMLYEFELGLTTRPIIGNGIGTTGETKFHDSGKYQPSHNFYAELLIEIGIIGAIFFFRFIKRIYFALQRLRRTSDDGYLKNVVASLHVIFFMYAVYSLNYYGLSQSYWYFFGGLVVALELISNQEKKT